MRLIVVPALSLALAACVARPVPVAVAPPPPAPAPKPVAALPPGATPGMRVPSALPDGSYPSPNRGLSPEAALWHLRAGLNVAALACRGANEAATVARYNALLKARGAALEQTRKAYEAQYRAAGGDWLDRWDDAMTRLYNHFSQTPARPGFCATADALLVEIETVPDAALPAFAAQRLPELDRPFTDFYRAYDAWRRQSAPVAPVVMAAAPARPSALAAPTSAPTSPPISPGPRLRVDPVVLRMP
jgi:hypothetical protein